MDFHEIGMLVFGIIVGVFLNGYLRSRKRID